MKNKSEEYRRGFEYAKGACEAVMGVLGFYFIAGLIGVFAYAWTLKPTDPTDAGRFDRSGMRHHIDAETGVHYLGRNGRLIPRLNADGSVYVEKSGADR